MFEEITFCHAFQPILDIERNKVVSYEVLLRGVNNCSPELVLSKINKEDLLSFDQYSREISLKTAMRLGLDSAVNLNFTPGAVQFDKGHYVLATIDAVKRHGFKTNQLVVEITESEFIHDIDSFTDVLDILRSHGVVIAIDDFGAGYAGLNMLAEIQPDLIKLDMSLLRGIDKHGPRQSITRAVCNVCLDLGIDILAEGVETEEEFDFLANQGISLYQGYFIARPGVECLPKPNPVFR